MFQINNIAQYTLCDGVKHCAIVVERNLIMWKWPVIIVRDCFFMTNHNALIVHSVREYPMSFYFVCAKVNVQDHLNNSTLKSMHGLKYVLNLDWIRTPEFVMKTTDSVYLNVPLLSRMIFDSPNYRYYSFTCHTRLRDNQGVCAQRKITSYQSKLNSLVSFLGTQKKDQIAT